MRARHDPDVAISRLSGGGPEWPCRYCGYAWPTREGLVAHLAHAHPDRTVRVTAKDVVEVLAQIPAAQLKRMGDLNRKRLAEAEADLARLRVERRQLDEAIRRVVLTEQETAA